MGEPGPERRSNGKHGRPGTKFPSASAALNRASEAGKEDFERRLENTLSTVSDKAGDIIETLERKLADLKEKNAKLHKEPGVKAAGRPKAPAQVD